MSETVIATIPNKPELKEEITLTEKAAIEIKRIKEHNNIPESHNLRVGVKGGGCSGFTYVLGFDSETRKGDQIFEMHGIKVAVDPKSLFHLSGTELDFSDGLNTVSLVLIHKNTDKTALAYLLMDALSPIFGAISTLFITIPANLLLLYLGFFAGFLLYIGTSDILPEAHRKNSSIATLALTVLGTVFIFLVSRFI